MARLIAPEEFGIFAVALTVWSILGSVAEFGLGADLVRREDYRRHLPTVATLSAFISAVLAGTMYFGASSIASAFGSSNATPTVQLMSIPLLLIGLSVVPAALLQRRMQQGTIFAIDASSLALSTALTIVLALAGLGPVALAFGRISGQSVTVILQYAAVSRWPTFGWDWTVAKEAMQFGMPLALANVVAWGTISVDNLIIARTLGPAELGLYVLAFNVASWPMSAAGQSLRVVALPALSRMLDTTARGKAMVRISGPLWALCLPMSLGLMFLAPQLVSFVYGGNWMGAVVAVVPLAAFGAFRVVFDFSATYLISCGLTGKVLVVQTIWLVTLVPALLLGVQVFGIAGAGLAHVAVGLVVVLPAYLLVMSQAGVSSWRFIRSWTVPTLAAIPLAGGLWAVGQVTQNWIALASAATVSLLVYVLPLSRWWLRRVRSISVAD